MTRVAGILGGMGPATTADFYLRVNSLAEGRGEEIRPPMLTWNVPLDYQVERDLLLNQTGLEKYLPLLIDGAQRLEKAGSDFIVVPCNTVHELYDQFSVAVDIPILHIVRETAIRLKQRGIGKVAVFATSQTVGSRLYQDILAEHAIGCVTPDSDELVLLDSAVSKLVTADGLADLTTEREEFATLFNKYERQAGAIVLGCTDFHMLVTDQESGTIVDSMEVLAESSYYEIYA